MKMSRNVALLSLVLALSTVVAPRAALAAPPTSSAVDNGAFVTIGKPPSTSGVEFTFGWNNSNQFAAPAVGYWIGVYDVTNSQYVWASDNLLPQLSYPNPGQFDWRSITLRYADAMNLPPGDYSINFFVRSSYAYPVTNVAVIELKFTVR